MAILEGTTDRGGSRYAPKKGAAVVSSPGTQLDKAIRTYNQSRTYGNQTTPVRPTSLPSLSGLPGSGGSRSGGGYGGGGGGAGGGDIKNAMQAYLNSLKYDPSSLDRTLGGLDAQFSGIGSGLSAGYQKALETLLGAYSDAPVNQTFDRYGQDVSVAAGAGQQRLSGITDQLGQRGVQARQATGQAIGQGDQALQALMQASAAAQRGQQVGLNNILASTGAGQVGPQESLESLFAAARATNRNIGTAFDAAAADRQAAYGGLQADVSSGMARDETGLLSLIAGQRAQALQRNQEARAQATSQFGTREADMLAQLGQQQLSTRLQLEGERRAGEQAVADRAAAARQALAELGIVI